MNKPSHRSRPFIVAGVLFLSCAGLMLLMTSTQPSERKDGPGTVDRLEQPRIIQGVPCSGYARLDPNGRLESCILAEEHAFGPAVLPANTQIRHFRPDGTPQDVHLGHDTRFDGHFCRGEGPGGWMAGFHPDGRLDYCFLVDRETIDGVPCEKGTFWGEVTGGVIVRFHADGKLKSCRLAADAIVAGESFEKGKRIWLDPAGKPEPEPEPGPGRR